jgi:RNA polymerase sigma-70 factor, ECF subfamily
MGPCDLRAGMNDGSNRQAQTVASWARQWGIDVFRYCRKLLASDPEAEDTMQMVFLQALEDFEQFRDSGSERSWLLSIARNRCLDRMRLLRRRQTVAEIDEVEVPDEGPGPEQSLADVEAVRWLNLCLDQLAEPTRTAIVLRYNDRMPYEQIEAVTGLKAGALRVRVLRGLVQLKECLESRGVQL